MKLSGLQKAMARQMVAGWSDVPQFQLETEVDCGALIDLRQRLPYHPSYTVLIVKAVGDALKNHPMVNAFWGGDHIRMQEDINVGVAVDTKRGLLVPVMRNVAALSLEENHNAFGGIKEKSGSGLYSMEELTGGTFTVSNLGMYRINAFSSIVNAPQSAILSVPRMCDVVRLDEKGKVVVKKILRLVLSLDHRVVDGASGSRFLMTLVELLENPERLLEGKTDEV